MVLLRHLLGDALRRLRLRQGRTLREVSASARVSLGYLSEVERGQKEASSELLAAICSALGAPLSQVLREVSDNFALAELQSEPVFVGVLEPQIEVAGTGHGPAGEGGSGEHVPVASGPVASLRSAGPAERRVQIPGKAKVPAAVGSGLGSGSAQLNPVRLGAGTLGPGSLGRAAKISAPVAGASLPLGVVSDTVFDQVSRTAREITSMVPV
jgi:transcriptional regulator with XRE-family HTH domain